jgi:hypothetical protein
MDRAAMRLMMEHHGMHGHMGPHGWDHGGMMHGPMGDHGPMQGPDEPDQED